MVDVEVRVARGDALEAVRDLLGEHAPRDLGPVVPLGRRQRVELLLGPAQQRLVGSDAVHALFAPQVVGAGDAEVGPARRVERGELVDEA